MRLILIRLFIYFRKNIRMRKLNLAALESVDGNVTLGFKTSSSYKLQLAQIAQKTGLSLSKYVNDIVTNYPNKVKRLEEENILITNKLRSFENPELVALFEQCKGQKAILKDEFGGEKELVINSIYDLQQVITKSFKNK